MKNRKHKSLSEYSKQIIKDWKNCSPYAAEYLGAMLSLDQITDKYFADSGERVVGCFLANAKGWRGPLARQIKKELNEILADRWGNK